MMTTPKRLTHTHLAGDMPANVFVPSHPLIAHKITILRQEQTKTKDFRKVCREISMLLGYEITRSLPVRMEDIQTPMGPTSSPKIDGRKPALIALLRGGLVMIDGLLDLLPSARVGHIGMYRDPQTLRPVTYYQKIPDPKARLFIVCDPAVATGHSACAAITTLVEHGVKPHDIRLACLVASKESLNLLSKTFPQTRIYCAAVDDTITEDGYLVPGIGDASDRIFGIR